MKKEIISLTSAIVTAPYYRKQANYNIAGSHKRIYHIHIRKTGGTSLNNIFLSLSGSEPSMLYNKLANSNTFRLKDNEYIYVGWNKFLIEQGY